MIERRHLAGWTRESGPYECLAPGVRPCESRTPAYSTNGVSLRQASLHAFGCHRALLKGLGLGTTAMPKLPSVAARGTGTVLRRRECQVARKVRLPGATGAALAAERVEGPQPYSRDARGAFARKRGEAMRSHPPVSEVAFRLGTSKARKSHVLAYPRGDTAPAPLQPGEAPRRAGSVSPTYAEGRAASIELCSCPASERARKGPARNSGTAAGAPAARGVVMAPIANRRRGPEPNSQHRAEGRPSSFRRGGGAACNGGLAWRLRALRFLTLPRWMKPTGTGLPHRTPFAAMSSAASPAPTFPSPVEGRRAVILLSAQRTRSPALALPAAGVGDGARRMTFIVTTAFPPSDNGIFENRKGGRRRSDRYMAWIAEADVEFRKAMMARNNPPPMSGSLAALIELFLPDRRRRDCDNFCKALLDRAVAHGAIEDDDIIDDLRVKKIRSYTKGQARLIIWPIEREQAA